jgi:hypothetical protein
VLAGQPNNIFKPEEVLALFRILTHQRLYVREFELELWRSQNGGKTSHEPTTILLATRAATCYPRSVNRNIFYIIGVIVVIVIVLKVLHLF